MLPLLLLGLVLLRVFNDLSSCCCEPLLAHNQCDEMCGDFHVPFPFYLKSYCGSVSNAFRLSCLNSTTLLLNIGYGSYRVLEFYSDGVLVDFPNSTFCRQYNDLKSFGFSESKYFGVSIDNVVGLYDCEDSSLCKAVCETIDLPACNGSGNGSPACCYPLLDRSVWHVGDGFSVFSKYGCRGFSCWVVSQGTTLGKRGVKLEWAIPRNSSKGSCANDAYVVNATTVEAGIRCSCQDGFVGDGFADGVGCLKSCIKDGHEVYGKECYAKRHTERHLLIVAGILLPILITASFISLSCLLKRHVKPDTFDRNQAHYDSTISFRKACRTRLFTYHELEVATKGFEVGQKLVDGTNGTIYAGVIGDGSHIAVHKVQCENERDVIQVLSQIEALSEVRHRNISCLLGCCIDSPYTPLAIYDYPANGTLEERLHQHREHETSLDMYERLHIVAEIATSLAFLQYEISPPIFHHDLKPGFIFLGEDLSVKIAGFGLLNPDLRDRSKSCNDFEGLRFYKNAVYNLGVLLLEVISGSKQYDLPAVALQKIRSGKLEEIVDPHLSYNDQSPFPREQIEIVADLATRCLLFGGDGKLGMIDVARELVHIIKESANGSSKKMPALEETFSNSSLLQMISMSPDSIYLP